MSVRFIQLPEQFWLTNPTVIFTNLTKFFPFSVNQTWSEKLNSAVRLSIYIAVVLGAFLASFLPIVLVLFTMSLTMIIRIFNKTESEAEDSPPIIKRKPCTAPTNDNPFMNLLDSDEPNRNEACNEPETRLQIRKAFFKNFPNQTSMPDVPEQHDLSQMIPSIPPLPTGIDYANYPKQSGGEQNLYFDVADAINKRFLYNQFYTTSVTTIPEDVTDLKRHVNPDHPTCKENSANCMEYHSPKYGRRVYTNEAGEISDPIPQGSVIAPMLKIS